MPEAAIIQRIAAKALIINKHGQVLVLREASTYEEGTNHGRYGLPGGRIDPGESFLDGLRREIDEETGLEVTVLHPVYVDEWRPVIKGQPHQIVGMFMLCEPLTEAVVLSLEHDDYQWINPAEAPNYDMMAAEAAAINAYTVGRQQ